MVYELEVRFYDFFRSELFVSFLKDYYSKYLIDTIKDISTIYPNNIRTITFPETGIVKTIKKEAIRDISLPNKKFTISKESVIELIPTGPLKVRKRVRDVYQLPNNLQLHITKINDITYEVEVERETRSIEDHVIDSFINDLETFLEDIEPHSNNFNTFLKNFNSDSEKGLMSGKVIAKPRDIEEEDFITEHNRGIPEGYTLTIKGNGIPAIVYFKDKYSYIVSPNISFKLLHTLDRSSNEEFMIIGEYMKPKAERSVASEPSERSEPDEVSHVYAPFDILYWSRKKFVRNHPNHLDRLLFIKDIFERNLNAFGSLDVYFKPFIEAGKTPETFAKAYKKIRNKEYPFGDDGLIMTPIHAPQWNPIPKPRQLSKGPEVCKIKPWHELSIDFRVNLSKREVYTTGFQGNYPGSEKFPFSAEQHVDFDSIPPEMDGKIVELVPVGKPKDFIMKFSRHRSDKTEPNYKGIADRVWKHIIVPLEEDLFLAKNFMRLRFQNRRIKKNLLSQIPRNSIVVDIGAGFGGDIAKYNSAGVKIVLCIEPDDQNRAELEQRIRSMSHFLKTKFVIINCGGEDTETIIGALEPIVEKNRSSPVAVVSMLSMSFFWQNRDFLNKFERTLVEVSLRSTSDVRFYFFTIEGNRFRKYFEEQKDNKIINYGLRAKYDPTATEFGVGIPGKVTVELPGTIVRRQREYLVNLDDLKCLRDIQIEEGVIESYMTSEELRYAKCHVYGTALISVI